MTTEAVVFDAFHPDHRADPFPRYAAVREATPLYPLGPRVHLAMRYAEVAAVLADPQWGHGYDDGINPLRPGISPEAVPGGIVRMDPPQHTRVRGLVHRAFTPRSSEGLRGLVERRVHELLDAALARGEVDLVEAYARPVPFTIVAELLGLPREDHPQVMAWSQALVRGTDPDILQTPEQLALRDRAHVEFEGYVEDLIARSGGSGDGSGDGENLVSLMAGALAAGQATAAELRGLAVGILIGGYETAADLIGTGVATLLGNPDQLALWRERPELASPGTDELIRLHPPIHFTHRVALRDRELAGRTLARGEGVVVFMAAANRDPRAYADPDRFDITRFTAPAPRPLSFGGGPHFCLGSHLGKLQVQLALDTLVRRAPALALAGETVWRDTAAFHGHDSLPVRLR